MKSGKKRVSIFCGAKIYLFHQLIKKTQTSILHSCIVKNLKSEMLMYVNRRHTEIPRNTSSRLDCIIESKSRGAGQEKTSQIASKIGENHQRHVSLPAIKQDKQAWVQGKSNKAKTI